MQRPSTRRRFLRGTALTGLATLAGCLGSGSTNAPADSTPEATDSPPNTSTDAPPETATPTRDEWLDGANGFEGTVDDIEPGRDPTVGVGTRAQANDGRAFEPAAVHVAPGTTITWEWTGHGGAHNVVATDGTFDSGDPVSEHGEQFVYTFEDAGTYRYVSEPSADAGMRGVVLVSEFPSSGYQRVDRWLWGIDGYEGELVDRTGEDTATVDVGTDNVMGQFGFDPMALKVSSGTTVRWEWTGRGGPHNVVFQNIDIHSGQVDHEPDTTFEYTFEESGVHRYACQPHRTIGQRGAVVVE